MKLSEAIREGSRKTKQFFGSLWDNPYGPHTAACALGAALDHVEVDAKSILLTCGEGRLLAKLFPILNVEVEHPIHHQGLATMMFCITSLNDRWMWSREAIAEWVEAVEKKLEEESHAGAVAKDVPVGDGVDHRGTGGDSPSAVEAGAGEAGEPGAAAEGAPLCDPVGASGA